MRQKNKGNHNSQRGSILIMTVMAGLFILGMTALVTDVGFLYYNQARLQTAVNAGWKAGYDRMLQISPGRSLPIDEHKVLIRNHILEVMKNNGYTDAELVNVNVEFGPHYHLKVNSTQAVGLFFARAMDFTSADVSAGRANHADDFGQGIVPLAIPHGVTKDLSRNAFMCELFAGETGFASGSEYILKLGSGGGNLKVSPEAIDPRMIFIPMDSGSQSATGFLRAYGAIFWCLRYDNADSGFVPAMWLVGYRGGSFMLPYSAEVVTMLGSYGVNHEVIAGSEAIQWFYDQANPNIIELFNRPRIAVHSNATLATGIELILTEARISYGNYSLPPSLHKDGWTRAAYSAAKNNRSNDAAVLNGNLDNFHVVFSEKHDLTGFSGGCSYFADSCENFLINLRLGDTKNQAFRNKLKERLCSYCQQYYNPAVNIDFGNPAHLNNYNNDPLVRDSVWSGAYANVTANCQNKNRRCTDKTSPISGWWRNDSSITICGTTGQPQCKEYNTLNSAAAAFGFADDAGSMPKPQVTVDMTGTVAAVNPGDDGWFNKATAVQKYKWSVATRLQQHVAAGGYLFAQSFAAETLDLALWQQAIYNGKSPTEAFADTMAFDNIEYRIFPARGPAVLYSNINSIFNQGNQTFNLNFNLDPKCQNHAEAPDTGTGSTSIFRYQVIKDTVTSLGDRIGIDGESKYLKGTHNYGEFTYMGGDNHNNVASKRLILNQILFGSMAEKLVTGGNFLPLAGKQKSNYGPVDPDNYVGGGANDYRDRFMGGFNAPLEINDRLIAESGNMRGPTDQAVAFRINGDLVIPPSRRIIVPITDVPPEVKENNPQNAGANTIYDVQGNDHPEGVYRPDQYDFKSAVRIIGFAEFEVLDPSEYTRDGETFSSGDSGDLGPYQPGQVRGRFIRYVVKPGDAPLL